MTTEERLENLERQLSAAKRRNRYLLAAGGLCLAIGLVAWVFGARESLAQPAATAAKRAKEVRAKEFILQDATGKTRAALVVDNKDGVRLRMDGTAGKGQAKFDVDKEGASLALELSEKAGTTAAALQVLEDGTPLVLLHKKGKSGADLNVDKGASRLILFDGKDIPRAGLDVGENVAGWTHLDKRGKLSAWATVGKGGPGLFLCDRRPGHRATLAVGKGGVSALSVYGEKITQEATLGTSKDWVSASLSDGRGDSRVTLSVGLLEVRDAKGKCIWSAPP